MKRYLFLIVLFLTISCKKDDPNTPDPQLTTFGSQIASQELYEVKSQSFWKNNDMIGVLYVTDSGTGNLINSYRTNGDGIFFPNGTRDESLFSDVKGLGVKAFYPYAAITNQIYPINISNQNDLKAIDLLYSNNISKLEQNNQTLIFTRQLAELEFTVKTLDTSNINNLKVKLKNIFTKGTFSLSDARLTTDNKSASDVNLSVAVTGSSAMVKALVIPADMSNSLLEVVAGSDTTIFKFPSNLSTVHNFKYTFEVVLKKGTVVEPVYKWKELPAPSEIENTIIIEHMLPDKPEIRNYTMLYDTKYKLSYWVAYPLHKSYLGEAVRDNFWRWDPKIDTLIQPRIFSNYNGWTVLTDRGHQLASADRDYSLEGCKSTFYFTNLTAQDAMLNRNTWADLEKRVRYWTQQSGVDSMYVVTGAMIRNSPADNDIVFVKDNAMKQIARPKYYYKALAKLKGGKYYTIGYKMENKITTDDYDNYRLTVKELEQITGFKFFPGIPSKDKESIVTSEWK